MNQQRGYHAFGRKRSFLALGAFLFSAPLYAADPALLAFGGERIGVPPSSLAESIVKSAATTRPLHFSANSPSFSSTAGQPNLVPTLFNRTDPNLASMMVARPRVTRTSGMPILEPSEAVDYMLNIVRPDPAIDFRLIVKAPETDPRQ